MLKRFRRAGKKNRLDALEAKLEQVLAEKEQLREENEELKTASVAGLEGAKGTRVIQVGGVDVELRPLSVQEWMAATNELPELLLAYAKREVTSKDGMTPENLEALYDRAKRWIEACADGEVKTEQLTVPEAMHALNVISALNGIDAQLATFFRARLQPSLARPDGPVLQVPRKPTN